MIRPAYKSMKKSAFTLIEIMVVVAVISILATVSISMMLRNRMTTNETVAITSCRTIVSACQSYYAANLPHVYPATLAALRGTGPSYIDSRLAAGQRSGYNFIYSLISPVSFTLYAEPTAPGRTGNRYFYTDETGKITAKEGARAGPGDPAVQ
jgi:prepilin-type N-terminal cleavage/methylation domain-containing protein